MKGQEVGRVSQTGFRKSFPGLQPRSTRQSHSGDSNGVWRECPRLAPHPGELFKQEGGVGNRDYNGAQADEDYKQYLKDLCYFITKNILLKHTKHSQVQ